MKKFIQMYVAIVVVFWLGIKVAEFAIIANFISWMLVTLVSN